MKIIYLIAHLLFFAMVTFAQPQQSENFRIAKSVLDAGGCRSNSTNFQLVSAFGQPTPIGNSASANFVLSAGFLSPTFALSPLSPIQELVIKRVGTDMRLWWEPIAGAESYKIFRDPNPLFTPLPGNQIGSITDTSYTDANAVSLPAVKYYYIVTAVNVHNDPVARRGVEKLQTPNFKHQSGR